MACNLLNTSILSSKVLYMYNLIFLATDSVMNFYHPFPDEKTERFGGFVKVTQPGVE
jgi:hypothetical protein